MGLNSQQQRGSKVTAGLILLQVGVILASIVALACGPVDEPASPGGGDPSAVTVAPTLAAAADLPTAAVGEAATPLPTAALSATAEPLPPAAGLPEK